MPRTQQIVHNGKRIYHLDFSNLSSIEEIKGLVDEGARYIRSQPNGSVYALTNIQDMHFNSEIKDIFGTFIKGNKPYIKASAVVGLNGLQQIVYNGLMALTGRDIKAFKTINEAKEWLGNKN
jgi:hypothetical protein